MNTLKVWYDKGYFCILSNYKIIYDGKEAIDFLNNFANNNSVIGFSEYKDDIVEIKFKDTSIILYGQNIKKNNKIIKELSTFFNKIIKYNENNKKINKRKVVRKNKYSPATILTASLLGATILISSIHGMEFNVEAEETMVNDDYDVTYEVKDKYEENINYDIQYAMDYVYNQNDNLNDCFAFEFENRSCTDKAVSCKEQYGDKITYYAKMYGVDPNVLLAIATQERGVHSNQVDPGGAIGLMQIQYNVWHNQEIYAYNFNTGQYDQIYIDDYMLENEDTNIKLGAMILQNCYIELKDPIAAVQAYNYGGFKLKEILRNYAMKTYNTDDINVIFEHKDYNWTNEENITTYTNGYVYGDNKYLSHVFSYIDKDIDYVEFNNIPKYDNNGNIINDYSNIVYFENLSNQLGETSHL